MKRLIASLMILALAGAASGGLTKTQNTAAMGWTKFTDTSDSAGIKTTDDINVSANYSTILHIDCCLAETTAHDGCEVIVQIASEATVNDAWTDLTRLTMAAGTAFKSDVAASEAIGQTVLSVTNPATGNLDHDGKFVFIYPADDPNIANCEIAYQIDNSGDAGDTITVLNGIKTALTVDTDVLTCDATESSVFTTAIQIPFTASRARVIFNNSLDTSGSNVIARVRVTTVTALE
jgi:hypothetical protein